MLSLISDVSYIRSSVFDSQCWDFEVSFISDCLLYPRFIVGKFARRLSCPNVTGLNTTTHSLLKCQQVQSISADYRKKDLDRLSQETSFAKLNWFCPPTEKKCRKPISKLFSFSAARAYAGRSVDV